MRENHIFIFGLGYVGQHLAHALSARGWSIAARMILVISLW